MSSFTGRAGCRLSGRTSGQSVTRRGQARVGRPWPQVPIRPPEGKYSDDERTNGSARRRRAGGHSRQRGNGHVAGTPRRAKGVRHAGAHDVRATRSSLVLPAPPHRRHPAKTSAARRATRDERRRTFPGDGGIDHADAVTTHAITIDAPPERVWAWLVQVGWGRGQWYTPRWVDRLRFPKNGPSAERLVPELQELELGDRVLDGPPELNCSFIVEQVVPNRSLVSHSREHLPPGWAERGWVDRLGLVLPARRPRRRENEVPVPKPVPSRAAVGSRLLPRRHHPCGLRHVAANAPWRTGTRRADHATGSRSGEKPAAASTCHSVLGMMDGGEITAPWVPPTDTGSSQASWLP
jgi:hypothetical protein